MMTRNRVKRFIFEAIILVFVAAVIVVIGYFAALDKQETRNQQNYVGEFASVLKCNRVDVVSSDALKSFKDINAVYIGYDKNDVPVGYVLDVIQHNSENQALHMLVGIDYESATVCGLTRIKDVDNPVLMTDEQFDSIADAVMGLQIPIATLDNTSIVQDEDEEDDSDNIIIGNLNDGVYYSQILYADDKSYIDYVEIEVSGGMITKVQWDAVNLDPTTENRSKASLSGAYTISGLDWATQSYNLCHALIEYQNPDNLAMKSDGTTEIVEGVTCNISLFVQLVKECISFSKVGYDKDAYIEGYNNICRHELGNNAETLGIIKDDVFVYSFNKKPSVYTLELANDAKEYLDVYEINQRYNNPSEPLTPEEDDSSVAEATPVPENTEYVEGVRNGGEDGVVNTGNEDDSKLTDSVDDMPISEFASFIEPVQGATSHTRVVLSGLNTCYKFLKEYLNWLV